MATEYFDAPDDVREALDAVLEEYFPTLHALDPPLNIDIRMAESDRPGEPAVKHKGHAAAATIEIVRPKEKSRTKLDLRITIDRLRWDQCTDEENTALLHHEAMHVKPMFDEKSKLLKIDPYGRPVIKLRPDDWMLSGFRETVRIFGAAACERQAIDRVEEMLKQLDLPFMATAAVPDQSAAVARVAEIEREAGEGGGADKGVVRETFAALLSVGHAEDQARAAIGRATGSGRRFDSVADMIEHIYHDSQDGLAVPEPAVSSVTLSGAGRSVTFTAETSRNIRKATRREAMAAAE